MSVREDDVPVAPVYTFADAHGASGEQRRRILGWPEEWGGEEGQLTGAGLMFQPPKL